MLKVYSFLFLFLGLLFNSNAICQVPQGIPYQAVARNNAGIIIANQEIRVRFTIRDSVATGTIKYRETFVPTTNSQGLFNVNIGTGSAVIGVFSSINWGQNSKFLQVELDPSGGSSFVDLGTQQMMSVPYALFSGSASTTPASFSHYQGEIWGGGVVFHVYRSADGSEHGLIVAPTDQSSSSTWTNVSSTLIGSAAQSNWNGLSNSLAIVAQSGHVNSAAKLCLDYVSGEYSDWYLPSRHELNLLFISQYDVNKSLSTISGASELYQKDAYWSSTENVANQAFVISFFTGFSPSSNFPKNLSYHVRAIRAF